MSSRRRGLGLVAGSALVSLCLSAPLPAQVFYRAADGVTYGPFPAESVEAWYREGYFPPETPVAPSEAGPFRPIQVCMHDRDSSESAAPSTQFHEATEEDDSEFPEDAECPPLEDEYPAFPPMGAGGDHQWGERVEVPEAPRRKRSLWR